MAEVKELSRLEEVELREVWPDEAQDFTPMVSKRRKSCSSWQYFRLANLKTGDRK